MHIYKSLSLSLLWLLDLSLWFNFFLLQGQNSKIKIVKKKRPVEQWRTLENPMVLLYCTCKPHCQQQPNHCYQCWLDLWNVTYSQSWNIHWKSASLCLLNIWQQIFVVGINQKLIRIQVSDRNSLIVCYCSLLND